MNELRNVFHPTIGSPLNISPEGFPNITTSNHWAYFAFSHFPSSSLHCNYTAHVPPMGTGYVGALI